jgi:nitrate/TMAO reductase-like tetraheme cytochrome c subunit
MGKYCSKISGFIKRRPAVTIVILLCIIAVGLGVTYEALHLTSEPEFCRLCHPEEGVGPLSEYATWSKNIHAANGVECLDCHSPQPGAYGYLRAKMGGLYDLGAEFILSSERKLEILSEYDGNPQKSAEQVKQIVCLHCHSDSVNAENRDKFFMSYMGVTMRKLDTVVNPAFREIYGLNDLLEEETTYGVDPNHALHTAQDIQCAECHVKVSHSGSYISPIDKNLCYSCHETQRAEGGAPVEDDDCMKCHVNQVKLQEGNIANKYGVEDTDWVMAGVDCASCHLDSFDKPTSKSCLSCHDEGYIDLYDMIQDSFKENIAVAYEFFSGISLVNREKLPAEILTILNQYEDMLNILERDGSFGIHNQDYVDVIFAKLEQLRDSYSAAE